MKIRNRKTKQEQLPLQPMLTGDAPEVRTPAIRVHLDDDEIIADNFAGGGGASSGIEWALGRSPDIAVNHDPEAIAMHRANHPSTTHYLESVWQVDPIKACAGRRVALAWFSPDCKHFSKAKGTTPRSQKVRGLAWSAVRWAQLVKPRVICLENVEEFKDWGPISKTTGLPIKEKKGQTFRSFVRKLERLGYVVEWRLLRAHDYGAPTSRRRFFMIARCDGAAITWPEPTHGPGRTYPYRTAAECIDWSLPVPSIFDRERPLADKTMARIARGIQKFVLDNARPFIVPVSHGGVGRDDRRCHSIDEPLRTITTHGRGSHAIVTPLLVRTAHGDIDKTGHRRGQGSHSVEQPLGTVCAGGTDFAIAVPYLVHRSNGERPEKVDDDGTVHAAQAPRIYDIERPLGTIMAQGQKHALVTAFLTKHNGGNNDRDGRMTGQDLRKSTDTVTSRDSKALTVAHLVKLRGTSPAHVASSASPVDEPLATQSAGGTHHAITAAHLVRYNGQRRDGETRGAQLNDPLPTQDTSNRFALVHSFLVRYNGQSDSESVEQPLGTLTTRDRYGLVTVTIDGEEYVIADIGMRMLSPRELFAAQGFDEDYNIEATEVRGGKPLTKTSQVRMCGNSVPPPVTAAIVRSILGEKPKTKRVAAKATQVPLANVSERECACDHCKVARMVGAIPGAHKNRQLQLEVAA